MQTTLQNDVPTELRDKVTRMGLLHEIFQGLDLTETQLNTARDRYEAVGKWLAGGDDPVLKPASIYPQGSVALGTATRPIRGNEFDVDLVCFLLGLTTATDPASVKALIGRRLRQEARYAAMLEEKPRCWRLNYSGQFHLDITPAISNPRCANGGELVPDKQLRQWKATNPKGYRRKFEQYASLAPSFSIEFAEARARAGIEPFPNNTRSKRLLPLVVQMCKRYRDIYFLDRDPALAPVSVILTTLIAWSYAHCARSASYPSELDFVIDVVRRMPEFIIRENRGGAIYYSIPNETTEGENFAEKWNRDPRLAASFFEWHQGLTLLLGAFNEARGVDKVAKVLSVAFGESAVGTAVARWTNAITSARTSAELSVAPGVGLAAGHATGTRIPHNTFFGR
ncbi:MAG: nucleotidyltransferase [Gammaproteobacteria bacterium]|nr:MAG: nucleotidyltransferase [Gammaproteobacteria bacterium]